LSNITNLFANPDKKGFTDIYSDGEFLMTLSDDAIIEAGLKLGAEIDSDTLLEIEHAVLLTKAKHKAFTYLGFGDMSDKKLIDKLVHAGFDADISRECADIMIGLGYIDNSRYAYNLAHNMATVKLYGPRRIENELCIRGISKTDVQNALDSIDVDFCQNAKTLIKTKFSSKQGQKLVSALMRYGYEWDCISPLLHNDEELYE